MSFNPPFSAYQHLYGFDDSVNPHWQMVPLSGEKYIYLSNAEGMTVQAVNSNIIQVSESTADPIVQTPKKRLLNIKGNSYGTTFLEVRKNNLLMTKLEVAVKKPKIVSLAFNFVSDKTGRTTDKNESYVIKWIEGLNLIFEPQANISFVQRSANKLKIENDLGPEIDSVDAKGSEWEWDVIVGKRDNTADINLFFVWKLVSFSSGEAHSIKGETLKKDCFINDKFFISRQTDLIVIAHEIGHALGIPAYMHLFYKKNRNRYMMFNRSLFAGEEIKKVEVNVMNL